MIYLNTVNFTDFPGGSEVKNLPAMQETQRHRSNPWVGKIPWERNGSPFQYSCLGNPLDRGAWWATVHGVAEESATSQQQQQRYL